MDGIDRKILAVLQEDASLPVAEIGNRVGLSSTPCWKRIQKLEAEGVIQRRVAMLDPDKMGSACRCSSRSRPAIIRSNGSSVRRRGCAMPEVMEFYRMAGDVDYMLRVASRASRTMTLSTVVDRRRPAEERHLALRHGAHQVDDRAADSRRIAPAARARIKILYSSARAFA